MLEQFPIYLINLDRSQDRLAAAKSQLDEVGLTFERMPAFDGRQMVLDWRFPDYDEKAAMAHMGRSLRSGEIACYLSHLACARKLVESGAPFGVVLEDDMRLVPGAAQLLRDLIAWAQNEGGEKWDLINLSANKHKIYTPVRAFAAAGRCHMLTRAHYFPMMAAGLLWSRTGARAFIDRHDQVFMPVDNYFRHWLTRADRGLAVWPAIVETTGAETEIFTGKRSAEGRRPLYGLIRQRRLMTEKWIAWRHKRRLARSAIPE
jgi:glycosyl transferase family 25